MDESTPVTAEPSSTPAAAPAPASQPAPAPAAPTTPTTRVKASGGAAETGVLGKRIASEASPAGSSGVGKRPRSDGAGTTPSAPRASPKGKRGKKAAAAPASADGGGGDDALFDLQAIRDFEFEQVEAFGGNMLKRYESYRRSDLRKEKVKKVCQAINPALGKVSEPYIIAVKGLAKVFVGDIVECALHVRRALGDSGPLQPKHLREAFRRIRRDGGIPSTSGRDLM